MASARASVNNNNNNNNGNPSNGSSTNALGGLLQRTKYEDINYLNYGECPG